MVMVQVLMKLMMILFGMILNGQTFGQFNIKLIIMITMILQNIEMKLLTLLGKMLTQVIFKILLLGGIHIIYQLYNQIGMQIMQMVKLKLTRFLDQVQDLLLILHNPLQIKQQCVLLNLAYQLREQSESNLREIKQPCFL